MTAVRSMAVQLAQLASDYNLDLHAQNIQMRVVDDLSFEVVFHVGDSSRLEYLADDYLKSSSRADIGLANDIAEVSAVAEAAQTLPVEELESSGEDQRQELDPEDESEPPSQQELEASRRRTKHLYAAGFRWMAYDNFLDDPHADNITFDEFCEALDAAHLEAREGLILTPARFEFLTKELGLTGRAAELVTAENDLVQILDETAGPDSGLAVEVLVAREALLSAHLVSQGWTVELDERDVQRRRTTRWEKDGLLVERNLHAGGWSFVAVNDGLSEGQAFFVDDLQLAAEHLLTEFADACSGLRAAPSINDESDQDPLPVQGDATTEVSVTADPGLAPGAKPSSDVLADTVIPRTPDDVDDVPAVDRVWRGLTREMLVEAEDTSKKGEMSDYAVRAFQLLKKLEEEGVDRLSHDQKVAILRFKGWGGVANSLRTDNRADSKNIKGGNIARALGMTPSEFHRSMLANRLESYYTPSPLIDAIWDIVKRAGVPDSGRFLEPGCGCGHMYAGAPESVQRHGQLVGIECDPMAARMARNVLPDATIIEKPFEQVVLDNRFDAVVGNVPFGETVIADSRYPGSKHIHDYFIVRSLDHLAPGRLMAVITSSGTMDKSDPSVRKQIMERANLVAGFRLPIDVFKDQSAAVTTDILVFQRRPKGTAPDYDFTRTATIKVHPDAEDADAQYFTLNHYFQNHPEHVLGNTAAIPNQFGFKYGVVAEADADGRVRLENVYRQLTELIGQVIPEPIVGRDHWPAIESSIVRRGPPVEEESNGGSIVEGYVGLIGDYTFVNGTLLEITDLVNRFDSEGVLIDEVYKAEEIKVSSAQQNVLQLYVPLRDSARRLVVAQQGSDDARLKEAQAETKGLYEEFVQRFGPVNARSNLRVFGDDTGSAEVCALEIWDDENSKVTGLSDTFEKRVIVQESELSIDNADDAYFACIDQRGKVDIEWMSEVSDIPVDTLLAQLLGARFYVDPATNEYTQAEAYLSGNVVLKLEQAVQAEALDDRFEVNRRALEGVQPDTIPFQEISLKLGANWIPAEDVTGFVGSLMGQNFRNQSEFKVRYSAAAGLWSVEVSDAFKRNFKAQRTSAFGTQSAPFEQLLEQMLNSKRPSHYVEVKGKKVLDDEATLASRTKQDELNEAFYSWVANDPELVERFTHLYNRATNVFRLPEVDGSRLTFPGLNPSWNPYAHQKNMVAMGMLGYNCMAAHAVGAGKTWEMVAMAMKLGQLGMVQKPAIAVPNHMLGQISREAKHMYPGARILMITQEDLAGSKRDRFMAIARNNKWDLVVLTHSMLNQISAPLAVLVEEYDKQIGLIHQSIAATDSQRMERRLLASVKSLVSKRDDVTKKFEDDAARVGVKTLDQFGIDYLSVDEAHLYKNLALNSGMNVLGVTTGTGSQRAFNLNALGEYLRQHHGKSFGMNFFTGTSIVNTMCELWVHNKMLRPELLEQLGMSRFDDWANRFGDVVSSLEALPEGGGFRVNERFSKFVNLPELINLFRTFADVKTREQLNLPTPEIETQVISVGQSCFQEAFMKHLARRAVQVRNGRVRPSEDNMLAIATAGRKAALDMRLVDPILPESSSEKLGVVADNVFDEWERSSEVKGTQIVFMDLGTPGKDKPFTCYDELKRLLLEKGIPEHEIAFAHTAKNNDEKEAMFARVRSGNIRVIVGSTDKMGVGTNIQERLCAMHNVDCPWNPAGITQRRGRGERVGNLFFDSVREYRYTTKDSFDLFMWETNKRKAAFTAQALSDPTSVSREVAEDMDLGFAEVMAVTTGNPKIRDKVEVDDKVSKLERKHKAWMGDKASKMTTLRHLEKCDAVVTGRLAIEHRIAAALPEGKYKSVTIPGQITELQDGDTTWLYATETGAAALSRLPLIEARMMRNNLPEYPLGVKVGDIEVFVTMDVKRQVVFKGKLDGEFLPVNLFNPSNNPTVIGKALRAWFDTSHRVRKLNEEKAFIDNGMKAIASFDASAEWPQLAELSALKTEQRDLNAWFAAQDFDRLDDGPDPYLELLEKHKATLGETGFPEVVDKLEETESMESLFSEDLFSTYCEQEEASPKSPSLG